MRVKAKCWLNYNGVWHKGGEIFDVEDFDSVKGLVEEVEDVSAIFPPDEAPKKRGGRPRKVQE